MVFLQGNSVLAGQRQAFTIAISQKTTTSDGLSLCGWLTLALSRLCCKIPTWHKC